MEHVGGGVKGLADQRISLLQGAGFCIFQFLQNGFLADHAFFRYSTTYLGLHCHLQRIFGSFLPRANSKMTA